MRHTLSPDYLVSFNYTSNLCKLSLKLKDIEEGHLLIENFVNIFFVTSLSVSLHNFLEFYTEKFNFSKSEMPTGHVMLT